MISNVLLCVAINTLNALTSSVSTRHYQHFQRVTIEQFFFKSNIELSTRYHQQSKGISPLSCTRSYVKAPGRFT